MRKALLVLTLVAASFAGGAVVNGPGLAWVRDMVGLTPPRLTPRDGNEPSNELPSFDNGNGAREGSETTTLRAEATENRKPSAQTTPQTLLGSRTASGRTTYVPPAGGTAAKAATAADPNGFAPPPLEPPATASGSRDVTQATGSSATPRQAPDLRVSSGTSTPESIRDGSLHRSSSGSTATSPPPGSPLGDPTTTPRSLSAPITPRPTEPSSGPVPSGENRANAPSWAELAAKLKAQGVSRFWIEGEPGQAVRFRCTVPVPGEASVSQQFEAEGTDLVRAADSVLRRIILWRATEAP